MYVTKSVFNLFSFNIFNYDSFCVFAIENY